MADPWYSNLIRVLAIENARTPQERAAAEALPIYPLPPHDMVWTLNRHNRQLMSEVAWACKQIDALHWENEALRREIEALRAQMRP